MRIEGSGMKDANGRILKDKTAVNERWTECFKNLMNLEWKGKASVSCMGMVMGGGVVRSQEKIKREVMEATASLKNGKAAGVD